MRADYTQGPPQRRICFCPCSRRGVTGEGGPLGPNQGREQAARAGGELKDKNFPFIYQWFEKTSHCIFVDTCCSVTRRELRQY